MPAPAAQRESYADPYLAGVGIGLVLLAAFLLAGRGLGASGAFDSVAAAATSALSPEHAAANAWLAAARPPLAEDWLVLELLGVIVGAMLSARLAGRLRWTTERGPHAAGRTRIAQAVAGGVLMGLGARLARGCTSGLGLTGGATLSVGAWLFIVAAFAAGFAAFALVRRQWT
jgi:uncharacterized protein